MRSRFHKWFVVLGLAWSCPAFSQGKVEETWDIMQIQGQKSGHTYTITDQVENNGRVDTRTKATAEVSLKRFNQSTNVKSTLETRETPDGKLYYTDYSMMMSGQETRTVGELQGDGKFMLTLSTQGKTTKSEIQWKDSIVGPAGSERLIKEKKLKPGETLTYESFSPDVSKLCTFTVKAIAREEIVTFDGKKVDALKVEEKNSAVPFITSVNWIDDNGVRLKSSVTIPGLGDMVSFRTTKEKALEGVADARVDVGIQSLIIPDKKITGMHAKKSVTYKFELASKEDAALIPADWYQEKLGQDDNILTVKIRQVVPSADEDKVDPNVAEEFLKPNGFIQSDNPKIIAAAKEGIGEAKTPWEKAKNLEKYVNKKIKKKNYSTGFATAAEVIDTCEGDCTEHSVLLTACCRAAGVPARGAMGLVYVEQENFFGYHMWSEVNIGGKWYPIDAVFGYGHATAGHIKIGDGSLKGVSAMETFIPVLNVMGKLKKIKVDSIESAE